MIPRKRIDIQAADLVYGMAACLFARHAERIRERLEKNWDSRAANLACLSVRSGFDALLSVLDFPAGSEILVSAVTIRDMVRIIEEHGLIAVPVDLDMSTLEVSAQSLAGARTPRTRAVLIAHLFGSRMPMDEIAEFCRNHDLLLLEDCAQSYTGDGWRGDAASDVRLFSFGPIKTATALGGAMLGFRDEDLCERVRSQQSAWPLQSRSSYFSRLLKYAGLMLLAQRWVYGMFVSACRIFGTDHEHVLAASVRGFSGADFFAAIHRKPSAPLLAVLQRRVAQGEQPSAVLRTKNALLARSLLPDNMSVGAAAHGHTWWVFPVHHENADALIRHLCANGFDATRGASSMAVLTPAADHPHAQQAEQVFDRMLYLPVHETMSSEDVEKLAAAVRSFDRLPQRGHLHAA